MTQENPSPPVDEATLKALNDAPIEGEMSGEPQPFNFNRFKTRKRAEPDHSSR